MRASSPTRSGSGSPASRRPRDDAPAGLSGAPQVLVEELDGPRPRELRRGSVVARCRVIVEAVFGVRVDVLLIRHARRLERRLDRAPASVAPLDVSRVMDEKR